MKSFEREFKEKGETTVKLFFLIAIILLCACGVRSSDSKTPASTQTFSSNDPKETAKPRNADNSVLYFDEICTDSDLSYGEYYGVIDEVAIFIQALSLLVTQ